MTSRSLLLMDYKWKDAAVEPVTPQWVGTGNKKANAYLIDLIGLFQKIPVSHSLGSLFLFLANIPREEFLVPEMGHPA